MAKPPRPSELERLVRYCHPAKILANTRLPGTLSDDTLAQLYGTTPEHYRAVAAAIAGEAVDAARDLPAPTLARPVLALGDSHTDDLASWAEILGHAGARIVNAGLSGDTTTAARARLVRLPPAAQAIVLLGTNDARRHGDDEMLVSHAETLRNLRAIDRELRRRSDRVTWITPPPVDERRIGADPALAEAGLTWRLDDVAAKADLVRDAFPGAVDLWPSFAPHHLAADGLHPSPAGQLLIAERVLTG